MIEPWRAREVQDWNRYRVVIVADVADLPGEVAAKIADFVFRGGGLLIAPGQQASPAFYNGWSVAQGDERMRFLPATLKTFVVQASRLPEQPGRLHDKDEQPGRLHHKDAGSSLDGQLQLSLSTLVHPALVPLMETKQTDLDTVEINNYWQLEADPAQRKILTGGRLTNGASWLLEKSFGRGKVLLMATALDVRDSNLPTRQSFVPLVHALIYHLAGDAQWDLNQHPAKQLVLHFPVAPSGPAPAGQTPPGSDRRAEKIKGEVTGPDHSRREAIGRVEEGTLSVEIDRVAQPGLYYLKMPGLAAAKPVPAKPAPGEPAQKPPAESADLGIPFVVESDPGESNLARLTDKDFQSLESWVHLEHLAHREDLQAIAAGRAHGVELWKSLVLLAFLIAVLEVALTRWIALRRIPTAGPVDFSQRATTSAFQEELDKFRAQEEGRVAAEVVDLSQYMG
jgi:hypothetical protein